MAAQVEKEEVEAEVVAVVDAEGNEVEDKPAAAEEPKEAAAAAEEEEEVCTAHTPHAWRFPPRASLTRNAPPPKQQNKTSIL